MPQYQVQEFVLPQTQIQRARDFLENAGMVVIKLKLADGTIDRVQVDEIYAENAAGARMSLSIENPDDPEYREVDFADVREDGDLKISTQMLDEVANPHGRIRSMRFRPRVYRHRFSKHPVRIKEYVGYQVTIFR
jgi:hypothetical protein